MTFWEWLAAKHPEVRLTPLQGRWADALDVVHRHILITSGVRHGRSFLFRLYGEYLQHEHRT